VSLDGARPESYTDVRLGAALPMVRQNARRFSDLRPPRHARRPELGIAFVAMRRNIADLPSPWTPHLDLPRMDFNGVTGPVLYQAMRNNRSITFSGATLGDTNNRCPFIEAGAGVVGWDGSLSPCLPLLHDHTNYLNNRPRARAQAC